MIIILIEKNEDGRDEVKVTRYKILIIGHIQT